MKTCNVCNLSKDLSEYYTTSFKSKKDPDKVFYHGKCKACYIKAKQKDYDPLKQKDKNLKHAYGISLKDYNTMYKEQDGKCACCGSTETKGRKSGNGEVQSLYVDHCHTTGKTRGLLCNKCNRGIGMFNDDVDLLQSCINYLNKYKEI